MDDSTKDAKAPPMPVPLMRDLFGQKLAAPAKARERHFSDAPARRALRDFRARLIADRISPLDVMAKAMMHAAAQGDWATAHSRAADLAPYFAPKLNALAVLPEGMTAGPNQSGALIVRWADGAVVDDSQEAVDAARTVESE